MTASTDPDASPIRARRPRITRGNRVDTEIAPRIAVAGSVAPIRRPSSGKSAGRSAKLRPDLSPMRAMHISSHPNGVT